MWSLLPSGGWEVRANIQSSDNHMKHNLKNTLRILHQIVGGFYLWYIGFKMFSTSEMLCVFGCDVIVMLRFDKNVILRIMKECGSQQSYCTHY